MDTMRWTDDGVLELLDQTRLPSEVVYIKCATHGEVAAAIKRLVGRPLPSGSGGLWPGSGGPAPEVPA